MTFCYLVLCWLINRFSAKKPLQNQTDDATADGFLRIRILQCFVAGSLAIALIGILIDMTSLYDRTFAAGLLRFYWFRLADIVVPLGTAFAFSYWIQQRLLVKHREGILWMILALELVSLHFGSYIPERIKPPPARADRLANDSAWRDSCRWISENTPSDARFFTPRLSQTFKWYARRAEVATWKDVPQDAATLVAWWNRIQDLFATGSTQPEFRWRENVTEMKPEELRKLAKKYNAEYLVAPVGDPPPGWKTIYRNQGYVVYRFPES